MTATLPLGIPNAARASSNDAPAGFENGDLVAIAVQHLREAGQVLLRYEVVREECLTV
jgi:hypothetical protein